MTRILLTLACARTGTPSETESASVSPPESEVVAPEDGADAAPEEPTGPSPEEIEACMAECLVQNQMRSVGYELIEADCRTSCSGDISPLGTQPLEPVTEPETP